MCAEGGGREIPAELLTPYALPLVSRCSLQAAAAPYGSVLSYVLEEDMGQDTVNA
jgi:hypothetical protein